MECLCGVHGGQVRRPLLPFTLPRCSPPLSVPNTPSVSFISPTPLLPMAVAASGCCRVVHKAAAAPPGGHCRGETVKGALSSLLRPASVAFVMGAAFFFARLHKPSALALSFPANPTAKSDAITYPVCTMEDDSGILTEEEKERTLEEYLDSHPEDARALRALMKVKLRARKPSEAMAVVDRLIALEPSDKGLPLLRAHLQRDGGDTETGKQVFEEMLQRDPFFVEAYHGLVMSASQSESEGDLGAILDRIMRAMELCKKEKRKEELRDFKLLVAQVKVIQGAYSEALQVYQELVKEEPRDFRPYLCQGIIYTLLRKKGEADKQLQKYRRLVPKGHPYAQCFDENMEAMEVISQMSESKRTVAVKRISNADS